MPCVLSVVLPSFSVRIDDREKLAKYVRSFRSLPYAATEIADYCFNSYVYTGEKKKHECETNDKVL